MEGDCMPILNESLSESKVFGLGIHIFSSVTHDFMHHLCWESIADNSAAGKISFGIGANFPHHFTDCSPREVE